MTSFIHRHRKEPIQIVWEYGKCGYYDTIRESPLTPCIYEEAESFCFDTAKVKRNGKYGYVNSEGNEYIPCAFDWLGDYFPGMDQLITYGEKGATMQYGLIDTSGNIVLPAAYDKIGNWEQGFVEIQQGDKWGFVNQQGQVAFPPIYDCVYPCSDDLAVVKN